MKDIIIESDIINISIKIKVNVVMNFPLIVLNTYFKDCYFVHEKSHKMLYLKIINLETKFKVHDIVQSFFCRDCKEWLCNTCLSNCIHKSHKFLLINEEYNIPFMKNLDCFIFHMLNLR